MVLWRRADDTQGVRFLDRAFSFRILKAAFIAAILPAVVLGMLWQPLMHAFWPLFLLIWIGAVLNDENVLSCPFCILPVNFGASVCHHCGCKVR